MANATKKTSSAKKSISKAKQTPTKTRALAKKAPKIASASELLERYRKVVVKIPESKVTVCRADVRLAFANAKQGVEAVFGAPGTPERKAAIQELGEALPKLSVKKTLELVDIGRALMHATEKVATPASPGEIDEKLKIVSALREPMLKTAEVLASRGLLPVERVAKIRSGSGKFDVAADGVALYELYREFEGAVKGKHPFSDEDFITLHETSRWLVDRINPGGAQKSQPKKTNDAAELRDRLWSLMSERHEDLRIFAYYKFRDAFEEHVPRLQSRVVGARTEASEEEPGEGEGG